MEIDYRFIKIIECELVIWHIVRILAGPGRIVPGPFESGNSQQIFFCGSFSQISFGL